MHLVQQRLIKIFVASLEMNPSALHGTGFEQDSLRGKKINQYSIPLHFLNFGTRLIVQFYCNLLSYRHESFTGRYATR